MDPIIFLEQTYGITLKKASRDEYYGPCPFCGGVDRFRVWRDRNNFWCRPGPGHCGKKGFVDELTGEKPTQEQRRLLALEAAQRRIELEQIENAKRLTALEQMHQSRDHLRYHFDMDLRQMEYWLQEGMSADMIGKYSLGWCPRCPTDRDRRPSYTIPVFDRDGETLINIRHRLIGGDQGSKYRPHMAGLGVQLFNSQVLSTAGSSVLLGEGEKKSIVTTEMGLPSVSIMGKRSFKREWLEWFAPFQTINVVLDPDAQESSEALARLFDNRGRVVCLPVKADDFFVQYGGTKSDFEWFLKRARPASSVQ